MIGDAAPNARRAGLLHVRLGEVWGIPFEVPAHLAVRLDALIGDLEVVYLDAAVKPTDAGLSGVVCAITEDLVFVATLNEVPRRDVHDARSSVGVSAWSRSSLYRIALTSEGQGANSDGAWEDPPRYGWPRAAQVDLWFAGREEPLCLPLRSENATPARREVFAQLLPSLVADLAPSLRG